ncbi:MAG: hypothetical protein HXX19_09035 [Rhodoferax sp.]|nr:hypothetical protein [Rhodoferax sp.]
MNKLQALSALLFTSGACLAEDVGRVISSTPVVQQVGVPRQVCSTKQVAVQQPKSGAGAVMGAIAGGAMGNTVGRGAGNAAATLLGLVGGAIVGDRIEGAPETQLQNVQHCSTQTFYESRTVGYNVSYEFGGKQYAVQLPQDPGPTIRLQVNPMGAMTQSPVGAAPAPVEYVQAPATVVVPAAPVYYAQPYYPPVSIGMGFGYWDHRHWH